jgi:hypothetical protein
MDALVLSLSYLLLFDLLKHAVKPILHAVLSPPWQLLHYLRPPIAYLLSVLQNKEIFFVREGFSTDLRIQEVIPPLSALLSISVCMQPLVQHVCNVVPLFGSLLSDYYEELIILFLLPLSLGDAGYMTLVPLVQALGLIPAWD